MGVLNLLPHAFNAVISVEGRQLLNNKDNARVSLTWRLVRVTTVAVEKHKVLQILILCL
jgi:hypothetical protein